MHTQNIKTAASESSKRWGEDMEILMAEGKKGIAPEDYEVYGFSSMTELKEFRRRYPEEMKYSYSYFLSGGKKRGELICLLSADHYKKFIKLAKAAGYD